MGLQLMFPSLRPDGAERTLFTVGSSSRSRRAFGKTLAKRKIELLVDVRRFPKSKYEQFEKENLSSWLTAEGIGYVWMGDALGGYQKGGYEAYTRTAPFRDALARLESLAKEKRTAVMCCERDVRACHRRFIARALEDSGWRVVHL